ncbi:alpha/beta hydrolase family protein [Bordetella sp. 02P26C-1]|uniref:alpha/beta hydrolase family protein n=1 Tax=Bordetella sp. 02P26C-1 TaxID=2683195 RepID=UPI001F2842B1|nr:S9 family peptidase [Bordetella sp. 02P26C-1]
MTTSQYVKSTPRRGSASWMGRRIAARIGMGAVLVCANVATLHAAVDPRPGEPGHDAALYEAGSAPVPKIYPLQDFFRNPERDFFQLADDGKTLGYMQPVSLDGQPARMNIFVQALENAKPVGEARRLTSETARDISFFFWKGNDIVLYQKDFGGDENFHVVAVNVRSGAVQDLTPYDGASAVIIDDLPDHPDHVLIQHNHRDPQVFDVYRVNVHTGASDLVAQNPGDVIGWVTDHAGKVRAGVSSDGLNTTLLYREDEATEFTPLITTDYRTSIQPHLFTPDNRKLYALSNRGRDKLALVIIDPAQPEEETIVFAIDEVDLGGVGYSPKQRKLTHVSYHTDKPHRHFVDHETESQYRQLEQKLPGYHIALISENREEDTYIVATYNDRTPGARYVFQATTGALYKLGDINPAIREVDMAPVAPIRYVSRDGLDIHGYLTLPAGRTPRNLPCVIHPHGGPWERDYWGYDAEVQFLANRGLCVLQMNFRGSTGYGRKFWEASFGQWGRAMQDDITDGVRWLIDQGIADPARIGIYGGSYGGYATLAGITFTPDLYAAAVDYVGVSNLFTFMNTIPPYWKPMLDKMHVMVGHPERDRERLAATSPALHVDRIRTPLLIAQGANDPRVNKAESDQVVQALNARGVEVQYLIKDNEGHGFQNEENRFEFYAAMEAFLRMHLKPDTESVLHAESGDAATDIQ